VLPGIPSGWRNNPAVDRRVELIHDGQPLAVTYRLGRSPWVAVDGEPVPVDVIAARPDEVVVDHPRGRLRFDVAVTDGRVDLDGPDGHVVFAVRPRFPDPDAGPAAGSLVAPMPGTVRRVLVERGDVVAAGQPLIVIEAMKMEHQVVAPAGGRVDEVLVGPDDQVETGQRLLHVELDEHDVLEAQ
jgi:propionyl-CoA carboxylase alpha chain